ncbi:hypothetical protein CNR22_00740 [Sphingobacteriaceae bacterium]|nr:hypothetical protein CNR22_00740 [Sphingobacteriaceae bacterium]
MKNKLLLLALCTYGYLMQAQADRDYSAYYDQIVIIEQANAREDFDEALRLYMLAFVKFDRVFARDAYNACQIAALKNHKDFNTFFMYCAKSGIEKSKLTRNKLIARQYVTDSIKLNYLFVKGYKIYSERIDTTLRSEFKRRYELEQAHKDSADYKKICKDNFTRIKTLARQDRFPGENLIGPDPNLENGYVTSTLLDYPYAYVQLQPFLTQAVKAGKIQPLSALYLYGFNQTRTGKLYDASVPADTANFKAIYNLPFGLSSENSAEVNSQRKAARIFSTDVEASLELMAEKNKIDYLFGY